MCLEGASAERCHLKASAVPVICAPFEDYRIYVEEMNNRFNLKDYIQEEDLITGEIDILIGSDFYWTFVRGETVDLTDNLVLMSTKVGYMLSGTLHSPDLEKVSTYATNCVQLFTCATDEQKLLAENNFGDTLNEKVERF